MTRPAERAPVTRVRGDGDGILGRCMVSLNRYRAGDGTSRRESFQERIIMGKEARLGLLLAASACLLAVMVDWVVEELK